MQLLNPGVQYNLLNESPALAGTLVRDIGIQSDAVLVTLYASSIVGTLDVSVYATNADSGEEALLFAFPQLTAATANLLLRRSGPSTSRIRIKVTNTDACSYKVNVRAVNAGSSDTKILGAGSFSVDKQIVDTTNIVLISSTLVDRAGLLVKNWSNTQTVYIAESSAKLTAGKGYPLAPKDALALDVDAGVTIWAVSDIAGADIRIAQSGG